MNLLQQMIFDVNAANTNELAYSDRQQFMNDHKDRTKVLFLPFFDNGTGLYRCLLPAVELNKGETHAAVVSHLEPFTKEKHEKGFEMQLSEEMIKWADYVVFPTSFHDITKDIEMLRQDNPAIKIAMDVDDHYLVPDPMQNQRHATDMRKRLIANMAVCDRVICSTPFLKMIYLEAIQKHVEQEKIENCNTVLISMPNLMSNDCYTGVVQQPRKSDKIRIGMIFNPTQFRDVNPFRKTLIEINKTFGNEVELIVFGWDGKIQAPFKNALEGVKFKHIPPVSIGRYFQTLVDQHFDICLMPLQENDFNKGKTHHKLLQYSQIGIPAICSDVEPYNLVISHGINDNGSPDTPGLLPHLKVNLNSEWIDHINFLISNPEKRKNMGLWANHTIQQFYTWENNREIFKQVFPTH